MKKNYGKEVIIDLHEVQNVHLFTRKDLTVFFVELCDLLDMEGCDLYFWDYVGEEAEYRKAPIHLRGTSAIQFISTSNITVHTLDDMKRVYLNIFSCKEFNGMAVRDFCKTYFDGKVITYKVVNRV